MPIYELTPGRHGRFLYNTNDEFVGRSLGSYGEWSEAEVALFRQIVRPGDTVLEAGANIGAHTVFLSRQVGDAGTVLAFEPARLTHQLLCANLALNECFNVQVFQQGLSDRPGWAQFPSLDPRRAQNFGAASLRAAGQPGATERVALQCIDALDLPRLDFLKADVEGFEPQLIRGAVNTLSRLRPVVYLEIDATQLPSGNRDELVGLLEPLGYRCHYYIAPMFNEGNHKQVEHDAFNACSLDLLCVPTERAEVTGLTQAAIGDDAITIQPGQLMYRASPWSQAQFRYLQPEPFSNLEENPQ